MTFRLAKKALGEFAYAGFIVLAASLLTLWLEPFLHVPPPTGIILFGVMIVAVTRGVLPACTAAFLGWLCYNFFLEEPRFSIQLNTTYDIYVFSIFAAVGVFTGFLSQRLRDERRLAKNRALDLAFLFRASQGLSAITDQAALCETLADLLIETGCTDVRVTFYGSEATCARGDAEPPGRLDRWLFESGSSDSLADGDWTGRLLIVGGERLGWAGWRYQDGPAPHATTQQKVLLDLAAAALGRLVDGGGAKKGPID